MPSVEDYDDDEPLADVIDAFERATERGTTERPSLENRYAELVQRYLAEKLAQQESRDD